MESTPPLVLKIRGCGNIANFKNVKRSVGNRLITDPEMKARKLAIQRAIECELLSVLATFGSETSREARAQSLMRSLPHDDRWTVISELNLTGILVTDGSEGCDITIERIA